MTKIFFQDTFEFINVATAGTSMHPCSLLSMTGNDETFHYYNSGVYGFTDVLGISCDPFLSLKPKTDELCQWR